MPQLFGYLSNDDRLTGAVIAQVRQDIVLDPRGCEGFGVGWLQDGKSLLRQVPRVPPGAPDVLAMVSDLPSRAIVAHLTPGEGPALPDHLQPFRHGVWLWAVSDPLGQLEGLAGALNEGLPDFLTRQRRGRLGAEAALFRFMHLLHAHDHFYHAAQHAQGCARALAGLCAEIEQRLGEPLQAEIVVVTERCALARAWRPLHVRRWEGIARQRPSEFEGHHPAPQLHPKLRALAITTASPRPGHEAAWDEVARGHVLWCGPDWTPHTSAPLELLA